MVIFRQDSSVTLRLPKYIFRQSTFRRVTEEFLDGNGCFRRHGRRTEDEAGLFPST